MGSRMVGGSLMFCNHLAASALNGSRPNYLRLQRNALHNNMRCISLCHHRCVRPRHDHNRTQPPVLLWVHPNTNGRSFSTNVADNRNGEDGDASSSNRLAFKSAPVIPSILAYIERIGVGIRPKVKHRRRKSNVDSRRITPSSFDGDTLDEVEELDYFSRNDKEHRLQWQNKRAAADSRGSGTRQGGKGKANKTKKSTSNVTVKEVPSENRGAFWLPPPPFSSYSKQQQSSHPGNESSEGTTIHNQRIVRRPVKLLGKAASLEDDPLPRESLMPEIAIAGRSNVGKSTLLNALLYGNTDETLAPRDRHQKGKTPHGTKLPRGVKAVTSSKPGETKELTFYQLTADIMTRQHKGNSDATGGDGSNDALSKMSMLLVDLPGYGFAFAKEGRTKDWLDLMHHYLLERGGLKRILLLLDARHGFKKADFDFLGTLQDGLLAKTGRDKVCVNCISLLIFFPPMP